MKMSHFHLEFYGSGAYYIEKEKENSRITVADSNSLDITGNLTVSMWVNLNAIQGSDTTLLSKYEFKDTMYVYKVKNKIKDRIQELKGEGKTVNYDELQKYLNINYKSIFWYRLNSTIDIDRKK